MALGATPPPDATSAAAPTQTASADDWAEAVIAQESGGDPKAVGDSGLALGMGQMHPEVRRAYGVTPNSTPDQQRAAVHSYFNDLWQKHQGNPKNAVMEYHLGDPDFRRKQAGESDPVLDAADDYFSSVQSKLGGGGGSTATGGAPKKPTASQYLASDAFWNAPAETRIRALSSVSPAFAAATPDLQRQYLEHKASQRVSAAPTVGAGGGVATGPGQNVSPAPASTTTAPPDESSGPSLAELEQQRAVAPVVAGVKGAASAISGGEVEVPGYGTVPAVTPEETLGESITRAPARAGAAAVRAAGPLLNAPGEAIGGAPVQRLTGSEKAGDVASAIVNLLTPFLGGKLVGAGAEAAEALGATTGTTLPERAGQIAQTAVPRAYRTLKDAANAMYEHAGALAEQQGARVSPANIAAVQQDAQNLLTKAGNMLTGHARDVVENIASHPGDVPYEEWKQLQGELRELALNPEQHAVSDDFVQKGLDRLSGGAKDALRASVEGTPAGDALQAADSQWKEVAQQRQLLRKVAPPKTGTEAARALGDPARERAAMESMTPGEKNAYGLLRRAASIQAGAKKVTPLIAVGEAGRLIFNPPKGVDAPTALETAGPLLIGAALGNPKLALLVARGMTSPTTGAAAVELFNSLSREASNLTTSPEGGS